MTSRSEPATAERERDPPRADTRRREAGLWAELASTRDLLVSLTASDLLSRYGRGRFLIVRWLFEPFAVLGVYLLLIAVVLDRSGEATGLSLACAIVPFQLVMLSVTNAMTAVGKVAVRLDRRPKEAVGEAIEAFRPRLKQLLQDAGRHVPEEAHGVVRGRQGVALAVGDGETITIPCFAEVLRQRA